VAANVHAFGLPGFTSWQYLVPILWELALLWDITRRVKVRMARCDLRIGSDGIEQGRVGGPPLRYRWDEITQVTITRTGGRGDFWIIVLPVPGTAPPPRPPKFYPYPALMQHGGLVLIGWTPLYHAKPEAIEAALVRFGGPKLEFSN
jgi:hypothetical protein